MLALLALAQSELPFRVDEIRLIGNARTADAVIERELGFGPGDEVNGEALASGQERVMNLQLFSRVRVGRSTADGRNVVEVDVEERWTLIPIPLAIATGDGYRVGGFFFESNLFGRNKNLAVGGFYSPQGSSVF
ncbi:MAG: POTRA domain-containing protein, partial [Myxococcota bacterium]